VKRLRIGTRGSPLAFWQANRVREAIERQAGRSVEIVVVKTSGDRYGTTSFDQIGITGVFTKELEDALFTGRADIAVHSMKDVPTEFSHQCRILPVFRRDDPLDALVSHNGETLRQLPLGARIGTSSLRRGAQLRVFRNDLKIAEIRGNVDTRLRKAEAGEFDAVVLAKAGLDRLGFTSRITEVLPPEIVLPAVGQGVLCTEYLDQEAENIEPLLQSLEDRETTFAVTAERALLEDLQGGCRVPLGAWARFKEDKLVLDACVLSPNGSECIRRNAVGPCNSVGEAAGFGRRIARELLDAGADRLLRLSGRSVGRP